MKGKAKAQSQEKTQHSETGENLQEQIRRRPYQPYEQRKREDGRDVEDRLQSESEVIAKRNATVIAA
jgi:hypothetical protein